MLDLLWIGERSVEDFAVSAIIALSHPPKLVVGGGYEGDLTPAVWDIHLIWGSFTAHLHICVVLI